MERILPARDDVKRLGHFHQSDEFRAVAFGIGAARRVRASILWVQALRKSSANMGAPIRRLNGILRLYRMSIVSFVTH